MPQMGFDLTQIKQKLTSPAWDQDTDSLEAVRDLLDDLVGSGFVTDTDALKALRDLLDEMAGSGFATATDALAAIRDALDAWHTAARGTIIDNLIGKTATPYPKTYPANADPVSVTATTTNWEYGSWVQLVPADTITEVFWVIGVSTDVSSAVEHAIELASGAPGSEVAIGQWSSAHQGAAVLSFGGGLIPVLIRISANTRLAVRLATELTVADTADVKLHYMTGL